MGCANWERVGQQGLWNLWVSGRGAGFRFGGLAYAAVGMERVLVFFRITVVIGVRLGWTMLGERGSGFFSFAIGGCCDGRMERAWIVGCDDRRWMKMNSRGLGITGYLE